MPVIPRKTPPMVALLSCCLIAACGLPRSGPNKSELLSGSVERQGDAHIVTVNDRVIAATAQPPGFGFSTAFRDAPLLVSDVIAPGDVLSVVVYENVRDDPLLGATGQRQSQLAELQVGGDGFIFIPYAGRIEAAGKSPEELRLAIADSLASQTPDPQVLIRRQSGDGATVIITGSAGTQGVFPIERPTRTLTAMLARAGGVPVDPSSAIIRVTRGGQTGKVWLSDLYADPGLDIALRPGDTIVVEQDSRAFVALGATGAQSRVPFETQSLSAVEALAIVGGLSTGLADPTGVFVFRDEPAAIANAVLGRSDLTTPQRMVYLLNLTEASGIFVARDFQIRDGDTVYVTEAPYVQWQKTLSALVGATGAANSLSTVGSAAK
jgi:polysaccharide export outer membrane protein